MLIRNKYAFWISTVFVISGIILLARVYLGQGTLIEIITNKTNEPKMEVSFIIGGDMMFARSINQQFGGNFINAVTGLDDVFTGYDASIINLEGAITSRPIPTNIPSSSFNFRFTPDVIDALTFLNINGASQANNHSNNAGDEGLETTRSLLAEYGIQPFGGPTADSVPRVAKFPGRGLTLAVIGINLTYPGQSANTAVPVIQELKKDSAVKVLVFPHWGTEYMIGHTTEQATAARLWVDAGADIVIGSHPHIIEDAETYKDKPIIYSLGNLLFDQDFSQGTREGLIIKGRFTEKGLELSGLPTIATFNKPALMLGIRKNEILERLCSQIACVD